MKHGKSKSPEYQAWRNAKERCHNPMNPGFPRYGGRGIQMCDAWRKSFAAFLAYAGERPSPLHSIDRIDNDKGYEPGNVRWVTRRQQQQNMRSNRCLVVEGEMVCLRELERRTGIPKSTIERRVNAGLATEEILLPAEKRPIEDRGVYWNKRMGKWQAIIQVQSVRHNLGTFTDKEKARAAVRRFEAVHAHRKGELCPQS